MNKKSIIKLMVLPIALMAAACTDYQADIDELNNRVDGIDTRLSSLETQVSTINNNIIAIQTIINSQRGAIYITKVTQTANGYELTLSNGTIVNIPKSGTGQDGQDGHTPQINVRQDSDGNWYWTVDGNWLLDSNGNKVRANGIDGAKGEKGDQGEKGEKGEDGDSFFDNVMIGDTDVTFTLADGTEFKLPLMDTFKKVRDRVQSIVYIPDYLDGMMTLRDGVPTTVRCRVMPEVVASALANDYASTLSFVSEEVAITRAAGSASLTISNVVDEGNGRLAITVTPNGLEATRGYAFALQMNDGTSMYSTTYTPVFYAIAPLAIGISADGVVAGKGFVSVGNTLQLFPIFMPTNTNMKGVTWSSSDPSVVSVSDTGLVTSQGNGSVTITVTSTANPAVNASIVISTVNGIITVNSDDLVSQADAE